MGAQWDTRQAEFYMGNIYDSNGGSGSGSRLTVFWMRKKKIGNLKIGLMPLLL